MFKTALGVITSSFIRQRAPSSIVAGRCGSVSQYGVQSIICNNKLFSTNTNTIITDTSTTSSTSNIVVEDRPYLHHGIRQRYRGNEKFKSPRKRASSILTILQKESEHNSKESNPNIWNVPIKVGDAVEIISVVQGGLSSDDTERYRGVILARYNRGLDTSIIIRDVIYNEPLERRIYLHSPLLRSIKILESDFIYKGKRKMKRAKLFYLRDRHYQLCAVSKY